MILRIRLLKPQIPVLVLEAKKPLPYSFILTFVIPTKGICLFPTIRVGISFLPLWKHVLLSFSLPCYLFCKRKRGLFCSKCPGRTLPHFIFLNHLGPCTWSIDLWQWHLQAPESSEWPSGLGEDLWVEAPSGSPSSPGLSIYCKYLKFIAKSW